jgi:hypothetical protein
MMDSRMLEALLQIAVLRTGGERGYYTTEIRIEDLLRFIRERYGIYVDRLPEGEGFDQPSIEDREALRRNVEAFKNKLREIGFYQDLSDAYVTQHVTPRYVIPASHDLQSQVRYLLTIQINGADDEVAGAALYELGLVPDLKLLENGMLSIGRLLKHLRCLDTLTFSQKSERGRVIELGLKDGDFKRAELAEFLIETGLEDPQKWTRRLAGDTKERKFWFDKWNFEDGDTAPEAICIKIEDLTLPAIAGPGWFPGHRRRPCAPRGPRPRASGSTGRLRMGRFYISGGGP